MDVITAKEQIGVMHGWLWIRGRNDTVLVRVCIHARVFEFVCVFTAAGECSQHNTMLVC